VPAQPVDEQQWACLYLIERPLRSSKEVKTLAPGPSSDDERLTYCGVNDSSATIRAPKRKGHESLEAQDFNPIMPVPLSLVVLVSLRLEVALRDQCPEGG
jgi:hypothetical protein